jgi:hypothetical protein
MAPAEPSIPGGAEPLSGEPEIPAEALPVHGRRCLISDNRYGGTSAPAAAAPGSCGPTTAYHHQGSNRKEQGVESRSATLTDWIFEPFARAWKSIRQVRASGDPGVRPGPDVTAGIRRKPGVNLAPCPVRFGDCPAPRRPRPGKEMRDGATLSRQSAARPERHEPCCTPGGELVSDGNRRGVISALTVVGYAPHLIVATHLAEERLWAEVLNLNGFDVISKPFCEKEVTWVMESVRRRHRPRRPRIREAEA